MRAEDVIADFLARFDPNRRSAEDAARDLIGALERERLFLRTPSDELGCPMCGGDYDE